MNGNIACIREYRSKLEVQAYRWREGLIALESGYDNANVRALHPESQKVYWQLREEGANQQQ